jgi:hypothetical protein
VDIHVANSVTDTGVISVCYSRRLAVQSRPTASVYTPRIKLQGFPHPCYVKTRGVADVLAETHFSFCLLA